MDTAAPAATIAAIAAFAMVGDATTNSAFATFAMAGDATADFTRDKGDLASATDSTVGFGDMASSNIGTDRSWNGPATTNATATDGPTCQFPAARSVCCCPN